MFLYEFTMKGFLKQLTCCNKKSFPSIIKHANNKDLRRLVAFTMEVLRKNVKANPELVRLIKQNRHMLRHIVHPSYSLKSKKRYLIQHGGTKIPRTFRAIGHQMRMDMPQAARAVGNPRGMQLRSGSMALSRSQ